jgi:anti-anti-sigma factor
MITPARTCDPARMLEASPHGERGGDKLSISSVPRPDGAELRLSGDLTFATAGAFGEQLRAIELSSPAVLIIDLREVRFLDSVALRALVAADNGAREAGRRLRLVMAAGPVERLFAVTRLDTRLDITYSPPDGNEP